MSKSVRRNLVACAVMALWVMAGPGASAQVAPVGGSVQGECEDTFDCGPTEYCCDEGSEWAVCCETGVAPGTSPEFCMGGRCYPWP